MFAFCISDVGADNLSGAVIMYKIEVILQHLDCHHCTGECRPNIWFAPIGRHRSRLVDSHHCSVGNVDTIDLYFARYVKMFDTKGFTNDTVACQLRND